MNRSSLIVLLIFLGFQAWAQHSGYAKLAYGRGTHEYALPPYALNMDTYKPGNALMGELGVNLRMGQFELTPQVGYSFNSFGYSAHTDSTDESAWLNSNHAYMGLGAHYAIPVEKLQIHEVLIGGGIQTNLPFLLTAKNNGERIVLESIDFSPGAFVDLKVRFYSNIGVWIEPSVQLLYQKFTTPNTTFDWGEVNATSLQAGLAFVLPFGVDAKAPADM